MVTNIQGFGRGIYIGIIHAYRISANGGGREFQGQTIGLQRTWNFKGKGGKMAAAVSTRPPRGWVRFALEKEESRAI